MERIRGILHLLRSYLGGEWHPSRDPHYVLIRGPSGKRRWHLLLPESGIRVGDKYYRIGESEKGYRRPVLIERAGVPENFGRLLSREAGSVKPFMPEEYLIWRVNYPGEGEYLVKPVKSSLHIHYPKAMVAAFKGLGAPYVPYDSAFGYAVNPGTVKRLLDTLSGYRDRGKVENDIQNNGLIITPYLAPARFWPKSRISPPDTLPPELSEYIKRLEGRNFSVEWLMAAPDRHSDNYLDVPVLISGTDGRPALTYLNLGIDYDWYLPSSSVPGLLQVMGGTSKSKFDAHDLLRFIDDRRLGTGEWVRFGRVSPKYQENPYVLGILDVLDNLHKLPEALDKAGLPYSIVDAAHDLSEEWNKYGGGIRKIYDHWLESGKP